MFRVENQHQVESARLQFGVVLALEHEEEVLGEGQFLLRMTDVERTALTAMAKHVESIGYDGRYLAEQFDALSHQVLPGCVIRILVEGVHFQNAAGEDVHDVPAFEFDDVQKGVLLKRHVLDQKPVEFGDFLLVRKVSGKKQIGDLLEAETFLVEDGADKV